MRSYYLNQKRLVIMALFLPLIIISFLIGTIFSRGLPLATAAGTVAPGVTIISPEDGRYYRNSPSIFGITDPGITSLDVNLDGFADTVAVDVYGNWQYGYGSLGEGSHNLSVTAVNDAGANTASAFFIIDKTSPTVLTNVYPDEDMTQVPVGTIVTAQIHEANGLDSTFLAQAISLELTDGTSVPGAVEINSLASDTTEFSFIPTELLQPNTVYLVKINNSLADLAGNKVWARSWKFTTSGNGGVENPHGNYADNVNVCINCHDAHDAKDIKLEDSRYPDLLDKQVDNYCNACHDGTAAPIPENWPATHKHDAQMSMDGSNGTSSCAACHNPHLNWTADNPNLFQDHYVHQHNDPTNPYLPNDSKEELCETCHDPSYIDTSIPENQVYHYTFQDKSWTTASGLADDYSLCLECHNGDKATDIETYYQNNYSGHVVQAADGTALQGHLPCMECHSTHGSENLYLLKEQLGQSNQSTTSFGPGITQWDAKSERLFCTRCHNNQTELYGKIVPYNRQQLGHESSSNEFCHTCHGGSAVAAAHAPE